MVRGLFPIFSNGDLGKIGIVSSTPAVLVSAPIKYGGIELKIRHLRTK